MSILINNNKFTKVYFGGDNISKIYKGKDLVFQLSSDSGGDDGQYTDDDYFEITTNKDISLKSLIWRLETLLSNGSATSSGLRSDITLKANTATVISASSFWTTDFSKDKLSLFIGGYTKTDIQYITKVKVLKGMNKFEYGYMMFYKCLGLKEIDLSYYKPSKIINAFGMFGGCRALTSLDVSHFDTSKVTDMQSMFHGCYALTSLDVSNFDTTSVTDMSSMFQYCTKLKNIIFGPSWGKNTASLTLDFTYTNSDNNYQYTDETWNSMLTMYDRAANGLTNSMTLKFNSSSNIPDGWTKKMTAKGYSISLY